MSKALAMLASPPYVGVPGCRRSDLEPKDSFMRYQDSPDACGVSAAGNIRGRERGSGAWRACMRRQTGAVNFARELPPAQGSSFNI